MNLRTEHLIVLFLLLSFCPMGADAEWPPCETILTRSRGPDRIAVTLERFRSLFHDILTENTVTGLREELKEVVGASAVDTFIQDITRVVGTDRIALRDVPQDPAEAFITNTDYLLPIRAFETRGKKAIGEPVHKAVIRVRNYFIVNAATTVADLDAADERGEITQISRYAPIADGTEPLARLEFKVGHPEEAPTCASPSCNGGLRWVDTPHVVDKPGIVLPAGDIATLFSSANPYEEVRGRLADDAAAITTTRNGQTRPVNNPIETQRILTSVGELREGLGGTLAPAFNIRYRRIGRKIRIDHPTAKNPDGTPVSIEIQVTVDEDIRYRDLRTGKEFRYAPNERVVELKIPLEYAQMSDDELSRAGLAGIATIRNLYKSLPLVAGTEPNAGKRARGRREASRGLF